ncbi:hypothetical protein [Halarcobacter anaerophilus]|jgi:Ca2+/Na+ antiporter|uniref:Glycosyl-4,4'-diaponeurosporenoate acyltransferase n=1 Tax=Halarcobacter anaerophilus TaxID=877500 RepID=A0A4Q0Y022_9BACT|nr:hypothetical protein [Halarcobacter anaerophilus]QDF30347.1 putative membrane protein [Halarcobacter anaerophilus]RXJ61561.1 hypothetical protein CRV06_13315 [Halarcobacter anaerophilus]
MQNIAVLAELVSNMFSILILLAIFYKYYLYKKRLDVIKGLNDLKNKNRLTLEDKEFIDKNYKEYKLYLEKDEEKIKLIYPVFILIAGILLFFFPFTDALIYLNVIIVAYIYLQINKIHNKNFVGFLKELKD